MPLTFHGATQISPRCSDASLGLAHDTVRKTFPRYRLEDTVDLSAYLCHIMYMSDAENGVLLDGVVQGQELVEALVDALVAGHHVHGRAAKSAGQNVIGSRAESICGSGCTPDLSSESSGDAHSIQGSELATNDGPFALITGPALTSIQSIYDAVVPAQQEKGTTTVAFEASLTADDTEWWTYEVPGDEASAAVAKQLLKFSSMDLDK